MPNNSELFATYGGVPLCGGKGSRFEAVTQAQGGVPKPLVEVGGKKLIEHTTGLMKPTTVPELVFSVGHKADQMKGWIKRADLAQDVKVVHQTAPGALNAIAEGVSQLTKNRAVVANTDEVRLDFELDDALAYHESTGKLATLVTTYTNHLSRHRVITRREDGTITQTEKQPEYYTEEPETIGLVNAGIVIFDKSALEHADYNHDIDWGGILDPLTEAGQLSAYVSPSMLFFNVGTPEEYFEAQAFLNQFYEQDGSRAS